MTTEIKLYTTKFIVDSKGHGQHMYRVLDVVTDRPYSKVKNWIQARSSRLVKNPLDNSWYGTPAAFGPHWRQELAPVVRDEPTFKSVVGSLPMQFDDDDAHVRVISHAEVRAAAIAEVEAKAKDAADKKVETKIPASTPATPATS